ncbi:MAG: formylglycine-generating enzyme family protein [Melioribacteraceae bacterium]|nr:formylglycine-generating enzyme family protein [Melioribacteraceae bacterium]MCF8419290.1 formylglycine-generating enzyme family protein [Melioribacteraceae bacterium]
MEFVLIESGRFMMGTPPDESGEFKSDYFHEVELTGDYYIGRYEVTQHQWEIIMGYNPSNFVDFGDSLPVENISWYEANEFIHKLDSINPGYRFSLPTEAQWEYACRAGTTTPYNTGENLTTEQANYCGEFPYKNYPKGICREHPSVVGSFEPNDWGLFDMHGNVWEWCSDWFCEYPKTFVTDPLGNCDSELKVIRGGSWYFNAESARSARRYTHHPEDRGFSLGFRVVMTNDNCQSK